MYKIYIDTADRYKKSVKILKDNEELGKVAGDIDVVVAIKNLLNENGIKPEDVEIYEANKGPGSFTGLKMGVTVSNVFNWALGKKKSENMDIPEYGREPNITLKP